MPDPTGIDGKYGHITAEHKQFHPDEPLFLLRATDRHAPETIRMYADLCEDKGCTPEHVDAAYRHAERMENWQAANSDLVKTPD